MHPCPLELKFKICTMARSHVQKNESGALCTWEYSRHFFLESITTSHHQTTSTSLYHKHHHHTPPPHTTTITESFHSFIHSFIMSYKAGISAAIADMKERNGSSLISIKKWMQAKLPADKNWINNLFLTSLKSGVAAGEFVKVKVRCNTWMMNEWEV